MAQGELLPLASFLLLSLSSPSFLFSSFLFSSLLVILSFSSFLLLDYFSLASLPFPPLMYHPQTDDNLEADLAVLNQHLKEEKFKRDAATQFEIQKLNMLHM